MNEVLRNPNTAICTTFPVPGNNYGKGETSGHIQKVVCGFADRTATACFRRGTNRGAPAIRKPKLFLPPCADKTSDYKIIGDLIHNQGQKDNPPGSYTNYLYDKGQDKILKKLSEECAEVLIAAKNGEKDSLIMELCDLLYHTMVLMSNSGIELSDIYAELARREGRTPDKKYSDSGLADRPDLSKK